MDFLSPSAFWQGLVWLMVSLALVGGETFVPAECRFQRWRHYRLNLSLMLTNQAALWLMMQLFAVWPTSWRLHWVGPLASLPLWANIMVGVLLLDGLIYLQHRLFHLYPQLWALHAVHHSDTELDLSSGVRFHCLELLLSLAYKSFWAFFWGLNGLTLWLFEIWLMVMALWSHSDIQLPAWIERYVGIVFITPAFHLRHHSLHEKEQQQNFGGGFVWWDYLFHTVGRPAVYPFPTGLQQPTTPVPQNLKSLWCWPWAQNRPR